MWHLKHMLKADVMKLKATQMFWMHLYIPMLGLIIFLGYYTFSPWQRFDKILTYLQVVAIAFPIVISIITSMVAEQEYMAGNFQNILANPGTRATPLMSKYILFVCLGFLATTLSVVGFYVGFSLIETSVFPFSIYVVIILILMGTNLFEYTLHFFLSFRFSKSVSVGVGIVESLTAALFLTGMGDGRWLFYPSSWSARFISYLLIKYNNSRHYVEPLLNGGIILSIMVTIISFLAMVLWFTKWEGKRLED